MKGNFTKHLWISLGIIFAAAIAASVALYFLSSDLDAQATKIISDKTLVVQQAAVVGILANLTSDAAQAAQYTNAINQLLPPYDQLIGFPQWVVNIGQAHHVTASVAFQGSNTPAAGSVPGSDNFSLTATGAPSDIVSFLQDIESQSPGFLLAIDSFDLTNNGTSDQLSAHGRVFSQ